MQRIAASVLLVLAPALPVLTAAEAPQRPQRQVTMEEAVFMALKRNLRLAAERINPKRADTVVVEQNAVFDPIAFGDLAASRIKQQPSSRFASTLQHDTSASLGVSKLFPLGTSVTLSAGGQRQWIMSASPYPPLNPVHGEEWGIDLAQPLLRGFGIRVNTAGIATARNERRIAQAQLRDVALATVADTKKAYWELVFAIRERVLLQLSLEQALKLQQDTELRIRAGALGVNHPDVKEINAGVAVRREEIVVADDAIRAAEDALKLITDLAGDPGMWNTSLAPATEPPRAVPPFDPELTVQTALRRRPDYLATRILIENQDVALYVRRNELLPKLDLRAGGGNTGLGLSWAEADHALGTLDNYNWSVGLSLEYPLGNRGARARYQRAQLDRRQAVTNLGALERQIQLEVRNAVREVATNTERRRHAEDSVAQLNERLTSTRQMKDVGTRTAQDVLDAEAALAQAQIRSLRALIDLNRSAVDVHRLDGTLLDTSSVQLEEE